MPLPRRLVKCCVSLILRRCSCHKCSTGPAAHTPRERVERASPSSRPPASLSWAMKRVAIVCVARSQRLRCLHRSAENRANVNAQDENGKTALHLVLEAGVEKWKDGGPAALVSLLTLAGADVKWGALMLACATKQEAAAAELMEATKRAGALDLQNYYKRSALHMASEMGLADTVAKLLALGADATLTDHDGNTALMLACANKREAAAAELMEATKLAGALDKRAIELPSWWALIRELPRAVFVEHREHGDITETLIPW